MLRRLLADLPLALAAAPILRVLWLSTFAWPGPPGPVDALLVLGLLGLLWTAIAGRRDPRPPVLRRWRLLFTATVSGIVAYLTFAPRFELATVVLGAGLVGGGYGLVLVASGCLDRFLPRLRPPLDAADVVLFNLCLLLVLGELTLEVLARRHPSPLFAPANASLAAMVERRRLVPGTLRHGFPVNPSGHYDEPFISRPPGEPWVAMLGDSFSVGVVPHAYHYSTIAERALGVPIYSFGIPAAGVHEYRYLLRHEVLPMRPEVVVVSLFLGNDVYETADRYAPLPHSRLRRMLEQERVLTIQTARRLAILYRERGADGRRAGAVEPQSTAGRRIESIAELERVYPWLRDPALELPTIRRPAAFFELELERARRTLGAPPESYARLFAILSSMRVLAEPATFLVVLIPDEYQVEDPLWREVSAALEPELRDRDRPQRELGRWLRARGVPHLDLLPVLRAVPPEPDGSRHLYHRRDTHWNARGNRVAGEALAEFLRRTALPG